MHFGHIDKRWRVSGNQFGFIEVVVKGAESRYLTGLAVFQIRNFLTFFIIQRKIFEIFFNVFTCNLIQKRNFVIRNFHLFAEAVLFMKKFKECPKIISITQPCPCRSNFFDTTKVLLTKMRKCYKHFPHFCYINFVLFRIVFFVVFMAILHLFHR